MKSLTNIAVLLYLVVVFIDALPDQRTSRQINSQSYFGSARDGFSRGHESQSRMRPRIPSISSRVDFNSVDEMGRTALYNAAGHGQEEMVDSLIRDGADVNFVQNDGSTPLHIAAFSGHDKIIEILTRNRANANVKDKAGYTPLYYAAQNGHEQAVNALVQNGANINTKHEGGRTSLFIAAFRGYDKVVNILARNGADVNAPDNNGFSPIYAATQQGHENVITALAQNRADVDIRMRDGSTPLFVTALNGNDRVTEALIRGGADVNAALRNGQTPLYTAAFTGHEKVVDTLARNGANINAADSFGITPLYAAAQEGHDKVVEVLIQNGVNVNATRPGGLTALGIATQNGHRKVIDVLTMAPRVAMRACDEYSNILTDRILGGDFAQDAEFPWMAALGYPTQNYSIVFSCGGTVISELYILTAAHCVTDIRLPSVVRLGKISLSDDGTGRTENRQIIQYIRHPNYRASEKKNDIALIRVSRRIWFSDFIKPACLNTDLADESPDIKLIATGWGIISMRSRTRTTVLRKVDLATVPLGQCNRTLMTYNRDKNQESLQSGLSESQYCARDSDPNGEKDTCEGDSGGPIQIIPSDAKLAKIVGIVSFGISCGSSYPGIYTRVAYYLDWIEQTVWPNNEITMP